MLRREPVGALIVLPSCWDAGGFDGSEGGVRLVSLLLRVVAIVRTASSCVVVSVDV